MIEKNKLTKYYDRDEDIYKSLVKFPEKFFNELSIEIIKTNNHLLEKGDQVKWIYFVIEGEFRVINPIQTGKNFCFAKGKGPDILGLMEVFGERQDYASTIHTLKECQVIKIPKTYFVEWVKSDSEIMMLFFKVLSNKFYDSSFKSGEVFLNSNLYNFTSYLIDEGRKSVNSEGRGRITLSKQQIADILGTSIRTIFRNIENYKERNLICVEDGNIYVDKKQFIRLKEYLKNIT